MAERNDEDWVQLATRIPKELHQRLKLHCVETDTPMVGFVVGAVPEKLGSASRPGAKSGRRRRGGA